MRSILFAVAAVWFVVAASTLPDLDLSFREVARTLFIGLAILSAAGVDPKAIGRVIDNWGVRPK